MRTRLLIAVCLVLFGCAAVPVRDYDQVLSHWVGKDIAEVIKASGPPTQTIEMPSGNKLWIWTVQTTETIPATRLGPDGLQHLTNAGGMTINHICQTTLEADPRGIVLSYNYRGDICR